MFSGASSGSWNLLFSGRMVRGVCWRLNPATEELSNKARSRGEIPGISRTIFRHSCQYTQQSNAGKDCFIVSVSLDYLQDPAESPPGWAARAPSQGFVEESDHWALLFSREHCGMSPPPSTAPWCRGKSPNFLCSRNSLVAVITMNSRFSVSRSVTGNPWPVVGCSCGPCALIGRLARHWAVIGGDGPQH